MADALPAPQRPLTPRHARRAARAGLQSLFIAGGIHAEEIGLVARDSTRPAHSSSSSWDEAALARLWEQHGVRPDYCMDFLK